MLFLKYHFQFRTFTCNTTVNMFTYPERFLFLSFLTFNLFFSFTWQKMASIQSGPLHSKYLQSLTCSRSSVQLCTLQIIQGFYPYLAPMLAPINNFILHAQFQSFSTFYEVKLSL